MAAVGPGGDGPTTRDGSSPASYSTGGPFGSGPGHAGRSVHPAGTTGGRGGAGLARTPSSGTGTGTIGSGVLNPGGPTRWVEVRDGHAVVVRSADQPEERARLVHAAGVLAHGRHRGVETLVALEDDGNRTRLVTGFVGARTLASAPPSHPQDLARTAARLMGILAVLHRSGIVHGRLTAERIVLGPGDRPVLCGFGDAEVSEPEHLRRARRRELAELGRLVLTLADGIGVGPVRRPWQWWSLRRCRRSARRLAADTLDGMSMGLPPQRRRLPPGQRSRAP